MRVELTLADDFAVARAEHEIRLPITRRSAFEALASLREAYESSGGTELFLSIEDPGRDVLVAYARLRIDAAATVRELKVFGRMVPIHEAADDRWQHRGIGRRLMLECERVASEEFGAHTLRVMSGVGVRGYYRALGYRLDAPYMVKAL